MASQIDTRITRAGKRVSDGRVVIGRQRMIIETKRKAGIDAASSLSRLAELQNPN
jgi:hypothetical protein